MAESLPSTIAQPLINGSAYSWADILLQLLGRPVVGVTKVMYSDNQEKVNNYGAGIYPISRGQGQYKAEASITLEMKELERIQAAIGTGGRLQNIPAFPITVSYVNAENLVVTHKLFNCEFTGQKREIKAGDTTVEVELPLILSHIQWS